MEKPEQGLCEWNVPFVNKINNIEAKGKLQGNLYRDHVVIRFLLQPYHLRDTVVRFNELNILLGADRYFIDKAAGLIWQPAQAYREGSWGYTGGQPFKMSGNTRLPYGTDKNIPGTNNDPVYQTQQTGIINFRFDVPQGEYELTLHFAELQGEYARSLVYNLSDSAGRQQNSHRRFDVYVNDKPLLENFDIAAKYGSAIPVSRKYKLKTQKEEGIKILFKSLEGEPVLNAIQIRKIN